MNDSTKQQILNELRHFTGTQKMWQHRTPFGQILLTDGCNFIRESCQARWLFDLIYSHQSKLKDVEFQSWNLNRTKGNKFVAICEDGEKNEIFRQVIQFSDFILDDISIWLVDRICLLPSEY